MIFDFGPAFPLLGTHRLEVIPAGASTTVLRHTLEGRPVSWLHDALIEDALDRAEAEIAGREWQPRRLPAHVRAPRALVARRR